MVAREDSGRLPEVRRHASSSRTRTCSTPGSRRPLPVLHPGLAGQDRRTSQRYYPNDVMMTGFDIIFFWVARMIMLGMRFAGDVPFRTVFINGLVRDEKGEKMSKTKGNDVDPLELIEQYGTDAAALHAGRPGRAGHRPLAAARRACSATAPSSTSSGTPRASCS